MLRIKTNINILISNRRHVNVKLGAGWQCQYPNICPNFVPCQNMSSKCPPYVLKMSMSSICPVYDLMTQLLSYTHPIFILGVNFCPVFVPRTLQIFLQKLQDKVWTKIDIDELCMKNLVTLSLDISRTFHGQTEIQILSNLCLTANEWLAFSVFHH